MAHNFVHIKVKSNPQLKTADKNIVNNKLLTVIIKTTGCSSLYQNREIMVPAKKYTKVLKKLKNSNNGAVT